MDAGARGNRNSAPQGAPRGPRTGRRGWWGTLRPRFDGQRCAVQIPMTVMLRGRLRQRADRDGVSMSEVVRRFCEAGLRP